jgi:hypothetical protein
MAIGACLVGVRGRRAGLVAALAAGLFAVGLAGAPGASALKFKHSAKSAELRDGRLILRGVSGRVTYLASSGRWATARLKRVHMGVFLPGRPATARLHEAGHRAGDDLSFRLTGPRYNAARRTVSFKAKRVASKRAPAGGARAAATSGTRALSAGSSQLGPASLTVTSHPTVAPAPAAGNRCQGQIGNYTGKYLSFQSFTAWDTDTWSSYPAEDDYHHLGPGFNSSYWDTIGGDLRGCGNTVVWQYAGLSDGSRFPGTFTIDITWPWGSNAPQTTCTSSDPNITCGRADQNGLIVWTLNAPKTGG